MTDPIRPTDDEARALARALIDKATHAALGTLVDGAPMVTRVALACDHEGVLLTLVSRLAGHTAPLLEGGEVSLLIGEPGSRGDPLTHPRLTLQATPEPILREAPDFAVLISRYVQDRPKAKLYADFADFLLVRFRPGKAFLNGGFGRAFRLTADDLRPVARTDQP